MAWGREVSVERRSEQVELGWEGVSRVEAVAVVLVGTHGYGCE